jgi:hypothetical protein
VERNVGPLFREAGVRLDHFQRVGVLKGDDEIPKADAVEDLTWSRAHRTIASTSSSLVFLLVLGVHRAAIDADAQGATVLAGLLRDEPNFVADWLLLLLVVEVAGVVPNLVHVRSHLDGQSVVFLQVDDEVAGVRLRTSARACTSFTLSHATRTRPHPLGGSLSTCSTVASMS